MANRRAFLFKNIATIYASNLITLRRFSYIFITRSVVVTFETLCNFRNFQFHDKEHLQVLLLSSNCKKRTSCTLCLPRFRQSGKHSRTRTDIGNFDRETRYVDALYFLINKNIIKPTMLIIINVSA